MRKVTVKLMGGLGNQMFQFSVGYKIAKRIGADITFDTNFLDDRTTGVVYRNFDLSIFKNVKGQISNAPGQSHGKFVIDDSRAPIILHDHLLDQIEGDIYVDGFFQRYELVDKGMRDIFTFDSYDNESCFEIDGFSKFDKSLMINVRRGDYVSRPSANLFHGVLEMDYFRSAIKKLPFGPERLFVFSDDVEWCRDNFKNLENVRIIDHSLAGHKFKDYLQMMSKFPNMIIPNSTFAWWAAWLSDANGTARNVIAPGVTLWFAGEPGKSSGLIPNGWTTIERKELL